MAMRLCELRVEVTDALGALDARLLTVADAKGALGDVVAMKNMLAAAEGHLARRAAEGSEWERAGFVSREAWLAAQTGTSPGKAKEILATAARVEHLPEVADAAARGELSSEQMAAVVDAAAADPGAAGSLVDKARRMPLGKLKDECARVKRAADVDAEATHARLRAERALRFSRAVSGADQFFGNSTPEQVAVIKAAVERRANVLFDTARRHGRREPRDAYMIDALEAICRDSMTGGNEGAERTRRAAKWLGLLRIDLEALRRGAVAGGELCEIAGAGPVSVATARSLLGDAVLKLVITNGIDVLNVTHLGRGPTVAQHIALLWNDPGCSVTGCARTAGIQTDHVTDWAQTRHTVLGELQRLCDHHHNLKTRQRWAAIRTRDGTVEMISPDDPRHPARAGPFDDPPIATAATPFATADP